MALAALILVFYGRSGRVCLLLRLRDPGSVLTVIFYVPGWFYGSLRGLMTGFLSPRWRRWSRRARRWWDRPAVPSSPASPTSGCLQVSEVVRREAARLFARRGFMSQCCEAGGMARNERANSAFIKQAFEEKDRVQRQGRKQMVEANERRGRVRNRRVLTPSTKIRLTRQVLMLPHRRFGPRRPFGRQRDKELLRRRRQQSA